MVQFRALGASLDYRRHRFTMDEGYARAVMRFFVHLRRRATSTAATRIVNWCPRCASTVSDLEVHHIEVDDTLTWIRYPLADGDGHVTIATVRPRDDARRRGGRGAPGRRAVPRARREARDRPGRERRVPIIADQRVEPGSAPAR